MERESANLIASGTEWLTARQIFERTNRDQRLASKVASGWLRQGRIFALACCRKRIYPSYGLGLDGVPFASLQQILLPFADHHPVSIAAWFESPSTHLRGHRPRELLAIEPLLVVRAAQLHRAGPIHG